ncbi:MAG: L-rhamnose/proton symporter RhaT [Phycisphaerae bacterium]|jgi:L-rhamnose-H+ transport protein
MVALGIFFHAIGGFAAGSFYIPFKKVRQWAWESYWLVGGFFSWIIAPWLVAFLTVPGLMELFRQSPKQSVIWSYLFGLLWGIGGLTFGLSMRYLGMSLGYAIALGFCATFGTIMPPIYNGTFVELFHSVSGIVTLAGVPVCLLGIVVCAWAGLLKEKELSVEQQKASIKEFSLGKGILVAVFAGIMSACMAFGFAAGKPIAALAVEKNVPPLFQNSAVLIVILAGGFTTNFIWCAFLNIKNKTGCDYLNKKSPLLSNYIFSALAGITWYLQFMFYGMGTTKMGKYDFSSWTIHMAFIIVFSNIWGLHFREWKGCSRRTLKIIILGIFIVFMSTIIVGAGNYLAAIGK